MKKIVYGLFTLCLSVLVITSCDNGNADINIIDGAPTIDFGDSGNAFTTSDDPITFSVNVSDGIESLSQSTLTGGTWSVADANGGQAASGTISLSGISATATISVEGGLAEGAYVLSVSVSDSGGNTATATFDFTVVNNFSVGIIGSATPGGWDADTDLNSTGEENVYTIILPLSEGEAKFRTMDDWAVNWGAADWPSGTGVQDGPNIPVPAGVYKITFNVATGEYNFEAITSIGIIGSATPGGWDNDTDMAQDQNDRALYTITGITLTADEAKFRANDDWAINWGAGDFPSGTGTQDGPNIPVTVGTYTVTFNVTTGEYTFTEE